MSVTFLKCPHKKNKNIVLVLLLMFFNFWAPWALAKRRASLCSMKGAALVGIKAELGKLRHKGALTTEQFELLKARTKDEAVVAS